MQKKSNPYSWIYLIITLVLALIMVYLMLPYLQESDLNERPHNAQVWGTVSDWAMVIITLVTAYFLWKNLRTSQQIQIDQSEITKMEALKMKQFLLPDFNYALIKKHPFHGGIVNYYILEIQSNNKNAIDISCKVLIKDDEKGKGKFWQEERFYLDRYESAGGPLRFNLLEITDRSKLPEVIYITVWIKYSDEFQNPYFKFLHGEDNNGRFQQLTYSGPISTNKTFEEIITNPKGRPL